MEGRPHRGVPQRLEKSLTNNARLFHRSHSPDGGITSNFFDIHPGGGPNQSIEVGQIKLTNSPLRRGAPVGQTRSAYAPSPCGSLAYAAQTGSALSPRRDGSLPTRVLPFARSLSAPKAERGATGWPGLPSLPNCSPPRALPIPIAATPAPPPAPRLESGPAACDSSPACALDSSGSGTSPRG